MSPPPPVPIVLLKAKNTYALWHRFLDHFPRTYKHTLGEQIDNYFTQLLELLFRACFLHEKGEKILLVKQCIAKLDLIKFFLQIAWEEKFLDHKKYALISEPLNEIGRMLGGWLKQLSQKTPTGI